MSGMSKISSHKILFFLRILSCRRDGRKDFSLLGGKLPMMQPFSITNVFNISEK